MFVLDRLMRVSYHTAQIHMQRQYNAEDGEYGNQQCNIS